MQGKKPSSACTAWLVAAAVTPLGGFVAAPLSIVGAVFVLFSLVIASVEFQR